MIDVVVVSHNSASFLPRLAECLSRCERVASVTIVDNDSADDSVKLASSLEWGAPRVVKALGANPGFGAAMNIGAAGDFQSPQLLIINPDVALEPHVLDALGDDLTQDSQRGVVGTALTTAAGSPVSSARAFPTPSSIARRSVEDVEHNGLLVDADWLCGALMLWRREAFEAVGGFSPEYFLYFEDVDICKKAKEYGWSVVIDGRYQATHDQGHGRSTSSALRQASRRSRRIYARKWHGLSGASAALIADATDAAATLYHRIKGV